jgi:hypothetical protein
MDKYDWIYDAIELIGTLVLMACLLGIGWIVGLVMGMGECL